MTLITTKPEDDIPGGYGKSFGLNMVCAYEGGYLFENDSADDTFWSYDISDRRWRDVVTVTYEGFGDEFTSERPCEVRSNTEAADGTNLWLMGGPIVSGTTARIVLTVDPTGPTDSGEAKASTTAENSSGGILPTGAMSAYGDKFVSWSAFYDVAALGAFPDPASGNTTTPTAIDKSTLGIYQDGSITHGMVHAGSNGNYYFLHVDAAADVFLTKVDGTAETVSYTTQVNTGAGAGFDTPYAVRYHADDDTIICMCSEGLVKCTESTGTPSSALSLPASSNGGILAAEGQYVSGTNVIVVPKTTRGVYWVDLTDMQIDATEQWNTGIGLPTTVSDAGYHAASRNVVIRESTTPWLIKGFAITDTTYDTTDDVVDWAELQADQSRWVSWFSAERS